VLRVLTWRIYLTLISRFIQFYRSGRTRSRLHGLHGRGTQIPTRGRRVSRRTPRGPRAPQPPGPIQAEAYGPSAYVAGLKLEKSFYNKR